MKELNVLIERKDGKLVVSSRIIAEQLGKDVQDVKKKIKEVLEIGTEYKCVKTLVRGKEAEDFVLTHEGLKILLSRYTGVKRDDYIKLGVLDVDVRHTYTRFELSFLDMLEEALYELNVEGNRQVKIGKYRIDFYIPKLNIVVEYDEKHHQLNTNIESDKIRQDYIEKELNCKFIRCDYKDSDIKNVMKVVKYIHNISF